MTDPTQPPVGRTPDSFPQAPVPGPHYGYPPAGYPQQWPQGGPAPQQCWGAVSAVTPEQLPVHLRPALPVESRDYLAFWRAPRYRWWKSLLALLMGAALFVMFAASLGGIGLAIDGVDF